MNCANHPELPATAAFTGERYEIPGYYSRKMIFLCNPCAVKYRKANKTQFKGKREAWEENWDENREREANSIYFGGPWSPERKWK